MDTNIPTAFISYSWDNDTHKYWVNKLATRLRSNGIDVTLDQWHSIPGDQLPDFIENSIRENDYVLIICTQNYRKKSEDRKGGVGYEGDIITAELFSNRNHRKFIPILRGKNWNSCAPSWLKGKYYISLNDKPYSENEYHDLLATILGTRKKAPPIGSPPKEPKKKKKPTNQKKETVSHGVDLDIVGPKYIETIFSQLLPVNLDGSKVVRLYFAADSPPLTHKFGRAISDQNAIAKRSLFSEGWKGSLDDGLIFWGPYEALPSLGWYTVAFRVRVNENVSKKRIIQIDINSNSMRSVNVSKDLSGINFYEPDIYQIFSLNFEYKGAKDIEYRIRKYDSTLEVWVDYIAVISMDVKST